MERIAVVFDIDEQGFTLIHDYHPGLGEDNTPEKNPLWFNLVVYNFKTIERAISYADDYIKRQSL